MEVKNVVDETQPNYEEAHEKLLETIKKQEAVTKQQGESLKKQEENTQQFATKTEELSKTAKSIDASAAAIQAQTAQWRFFRSIVTALTVIGIILAVGAILLLLEGKTVSDGYIAIISAIVGALAGAMIPKGADTSAQKG